MQKIMQTVEFEPGTYQLEILWVNNYTMGPACRTTSTKNKTNRPISDESMFTIFLYTKLLYISSMRPSLNKTTIFKLIVRGIEQHLAFEERENKP